MSDKNEPLTLNVRQAAKISGFHHNTISRAVKKGELKARVYGKADVPGPRLVIVRRDLMEWLESMPAYQMAENG